MTTRSDEWSPLERDTNWVQMVNSLLKDGGRIAYPSTGLVYEINKKDRTWTLVNPEELLNPEARDIHLKTMRVLETIEWKGRVRV